MTHNYSFSGQTPFEYTIKNSGYFYTAMIKNKYVTEEDYRKYAAPQKYKV